MMTEEHERIISSMNEFYRDYHNETPTYLDLAIRTCDAFGLFTEGSYRVPNWIIYAAKMVMAIHEETKP